MNCVCFLDVGVLSCRGNYLLTGSNTRWLRLWEMEAVQRFQPEVKDCNLRDRWVVYSGKDLFLSNTQVLFFILLILFFIANLTNCV